MANSITSLDRIFTHILHRADGPKLNEKRERRIDGLIEILVRRTRTTHDAGKSAAFEDRLAMARMLRHLAAACSVHSFIQTHARNPLFREVDPHSKFGEYGAWLFEQLSGRWHTESRLLGFTIEKLEEKLRFVHRDSYATCWDEDSFFSQEECARIHEEELLE